VETSWHRGPYNYRAAMTPRTGQIIETVIEIAMQRGKTPSQVAMAWCLSRPGVTSVITGADTPERVRENCGAVGWQLNSEDKSRLDAVSQGMSLTVLKDCPEGYTAEGL
jgi:aryl-alcohol dehydrogenase-like predicted oxidoreductase